MYYVNRNDSIVLLLFIFERYRNARYYSQPYKVNDNQELVSLLSQKCFQTKVYNQSIELHSNIRTKRIIPKATNH